MLRQYNIYQKIQEIPHVSLINGEIQYKSLENQSNQ